MYGCDEENHGFAHNDIIISRVGVENENSLLLDISKGLGGAGNVLLEQAKLISTIHDVIVVIPCNVDGEMNPKYELRCKKRMLDM